MSKKHKVVDKITGVERKCRVCGHRIEPGLPYKGRLGYDTGMVCGDVGRVCGKILHAIKVPVTKLDYEWSGGR